MSTITVLCSLIFNTYAYELQIGKLTGGIANRKYYIGISDQTYVSDCAAAMNAWNYAVQNTPETANMGFNFTRTYTESQAALRFYCENAPNQGFTGLTRYYFYNSDGNITEASDAYHRDYASLILNTAILNRKPEYIKSVAGHEAGHGMGLKHNPTNIGTLMFQGADKRTATVPTRDDVLGIYEKYS